MSEDGEQEKEVARQEVEGAIAELQVALSNMRDGAQECEPFEIKMVEQLLALLQGADSVDEALNARLDALQLEITECNYGVCYRTGAEIDELLDEYEYLENWLENRP